LIGYLSQPSLSVVCDLIKELSALAQFHDEVHGSGSEEHFSELYNIGMVHLLGGWNGRDFIIRNKGSDK
jgi:hypothetical protein